MYRANLQGRSADGERGIWTLAPLLTTYSLSRGAPSTSWVFLQKPYRTNYMSKVILEAERMGFEPMCPEGQTVFKTASLWPLRYLSVSNSLFPAFCFMHLAEVYQLVAVCWTQEIYYQTIPVVSNKILSNFYSRFTFFTVNVQFSALPRALILSVSFYEMSLFPKSILYLRFRLHPSSLLLH